MRLCQNPVIASARHKFWIDAADFEFFESGGGGNKESIFGSIPNRNETPPGKKTTIGDPLRNLSLLFPCDDYNKMRERDWFTLYNYVHGLQDFTTDCAPKK